MSTNVIEFQAGDLTLAIDPETDRWLSLTGGQSGRSWLSLAEDAQTGLPFVGGDAIHGEQYIPMIYSSGNDGQLKAISHRGETHLTLNANNNALSTHLQLPDFRCPRSGLSLDLDHLDMPTGDPKDQLMPVAIATNEDLSWAYLVWHRSEDDLLVMTIKGPFAGWLIKYSYAGHRMTGFQVLNRADDVIAKADRFSNGRLPSSTSFEINFALASSREAAMEKAIELLGLAAVKATSNSIIAGSTCELATFGDCQSLSWLKPNGETSKLDPSTKHITLEDAGVHCLTATASNGLTHQSHLLALGDWQAMTSTAIDFHREHYQLDCGAFARCVSGDTLKPDSKTIEGTPFGDPETGMSCRTGEFGGYGAWVQLRYMRAFEDNPTMKASVQAYFDWLMNKGREDNPRPGTLCYTSQTFNGIEWGPYHFYQEVCYAQHEAWLMGQMAEAIDMGWDHLIDALIGLSRHYLDEHMDENGVVWNQNFKEETPVDYCTVDAPPLHVIAAGKALKPKGQPIGDELLARGRKSIEHLYARGFNFPTEGEACTEDGSIACQAWGLATGYLELENPDPAWLSMAEELMAFHSKLEMHGWDIRTDGSTIRFWETMYESKDYGPSINASHGWTIWSAWARWACFLGTGKFEHLWQCWRHTTNVAHRMNKDGGFPSCYTPDVIPALPHDDGWGDPTKRYEGRMSTSFMGHGYPETLSMSGMHLFVMAPRNWYHACGCDAASGRLANATLTGNLLKPNTATPCEIIGLGDGDYTNLTITGLSKDKPVSIYTTAPIEAKGFELIEDRGYVKVGRVSSGQITIS